jgi:hypothetical protein
VVTKPNTDGAAALRGFEIHTVATIGARVHVSGREFLHTHRQSSHLVERASVVSLLFGPRISTPPLDRVSVAHPVRAKHDPQTLGFTITSRHASER